MSAVPHLVVAPVLLPMATAALVLLLPARARALASAASAAAGLVVAALLVARVMAGEPPAAIGVYLPSNWPVPFGIVLAADRLAAFMLAVTAVVGLAAIVFSLGRWDRAGPHFHSLAHVLLMGLNGAFLTADVFNLFVFFEIALAASYALVLHGSGRARVGAGLHYLAINLLASSFFLVGVAVLYGITGTLNLADMAAKLPQVPPSDRGLLHAGAAILGIAFLAKAAIWPINSWLVPAYAAAAAPVGALFVLLTKLGVYAALRTWSLLLSTEPGEATAFGGAALAFGGLLTLAFGSAAMLGAQQVHRLAAHAVVVSSGTLLAAIGFAHSPLAGGALYYLAVSTLATSALFLLAELVERSRAGPSASPTPYDDDLGASAVYVAGPDPRGEDASSDEAPVGRAIPGTIAFLGLSFAACALLVAGLPPLSGFLAKFAMLTTVLDVETPAMRTAAWSFFVLAIASGLLSTVVLSRAGVRYFWAPRDRALPRVRWNEGAPIAFLLAAAVALTVYAQPVIVYARAAAGDLFAPSGYVEAILSARPLPGPTNPDPGGAR